MTSSSQDVLAYTRYVDTAGLTRKQAGGVVVEFKGILGKIVSLESKVKLHAWMLGLIAAVLVISQLQRWFSKI